MYEIRVQVGTCASQCAEIGRVVPRRSRRGAGPAAIGQNPLMASVDPVAAVSFWLATDEPAVAPSLAGAATADVAIIGAGFTGLWAALQLLETDPALRVTVVEMERVGFGATGRNGGFCQASLTHGLETGRRHIPDELTCSTAKGWQTCGRSSTSRG